MRWNKQKVEIEYRDGTSTTWGGFSDGKLSVPTLVNDLDGYSPDTSVRFSEVTFSKRSVSSLDLVEVRYTYSDGSTSVDTTVRTVHSFDPVLDD